MQSESSLRRVPRVLPWGAAGALAAVPLGAEAHVKWFSKVVNCVTTPLEMSDVLAMPLFMGLYLSALVVMAGVFWIDRAVARYDFRGRGPLALADASGAALFLRGGVAVYFASVAWYAAYRPFILTPELFSGAPWVPAVQLVIALTVLWGRTVCIGLSGLLLLYAYSAWIYGWFHLLDYLYFLGISVHLALHAFGSSRRSTVAPAVLRLSVGFSLMWVGVEKWVYPAWSYDVLNHELRQIAVGIDHRFFVMAAGFVEFCLAFLVVFGRVSSQVSSIVLLALLLGAIPLAGPLDAIGHLPLVVGLLILAVAPQPLVSPPARRRDGKTGWRVCGFALSIPGFIGLYQLAHRAAYPSYADWPSAELLAAVALAALLCLRTARMHRLVQPFQRFTKGVRRRLSAATPSRPTASKAEVPGSGAVDTASST
ncbi:hypothetical protein OOT46_21655 [Aquabacterium sp. A7-Y]|uniref:hypothetical protein n=1 Tax=Aquabacterium sp. A7-Y TaxID=1349605 RepID=UPI00223E1B5F|nr:hypothetical protein [Aquabacterium sp. A7-Y]MCW7540438.1 hypothetical protein [Aquabacterium sp. A7-Y]